MSRLYKFAFPAVMIFIMVATVFRYESVVRGRGSEHRFEVEVKDLDSVVRAMRDATLCPVHVENISGDRYSLVVRCPKDRVGALFGIMQKFGYKRPE